MWVLVKCTVWVHMINVVLLFSTDELHLEIKVMYQGMRLRKVEEDIQAIIAQQQQALDSWELHAAPISPAAAPGSG